MKDRGHLVVLAALPPRLVRFLVGGTRQHGRRDECGARVLCSDHLADPACARKDHAGFAAIRRQLPEGADGVVIRAIGIGAGRREVEVPRGGKGRAGLALGAPGDPAGVLLPRGVQLPQGSDILRALAVQRGDGGHQALPVRAQRQPAHSGYGEVVVDVVERGRRLFAQDR
ncbi:hypothetical protein D9M72_498980 [compost metagenome]